MEDQSQLMSGIGTRMEVKDLSDPDSIRVPAHTALSTRSGILAFLLAGFIASIFLDSVKVIPGLEDDSIASLAGYLLLGGFLLLHPLHAWSMHGPGRIFVFFFGATVLIEGIRYYDGGAMPDRDTGLRFYFQYLQVFVLYFISVNIVQDVRAIRWAQITFLACVGSIALMVMAGVGGVDTDKSGGREGFSLMNLNNQAFLYSVMVVGVALVLMRRRNPMRLRVVLGALAILACLALARTGSRSGALVLVVGLLMVVAIGTLDVERGRSLLMTLCLVVGAAFALLRSEVLRERLMETRDAGQTGHRLELAEAGWELAGESPAIGHGAAYVFPLAIKASWPRDRVSAHNMYLQMLLSFGWVGFLIWLIALFGVVWDCWKARATLGGITMLCVMIMLMISGFGGGYMTEKFAWVLLAMASAVRDWAPRLEEEILS